MTEQEMTLWLQDAVLGFADIQELEMTTSTFQEAGILSGNHGLVVRIGDVEFQITVVQAR